MYIYICALYVFMNICTNVFMCTCVHIYVYMYMYMSIFGYIFKSIDVYMYICIAEEPVLFLSTMRR
jgi:hypothetical protein